LTGCKIQACFLLLTVNHVIEILTTQVAASSYCRDWIQDTNGQEFPFVKIPTGFVHFPTDVAYGMQVAVTPGSTSFLNASEIVDLDFCCESTEYGALECGAQFEPSIQTGTLLKEIVWG
jgi:hypothetical protein